MSMSYPNKIKIGPYDYNVETVDHLMDLQGELYGQHDPSSNTIRINGAIKNEQIKAETLWHEILHAIWNIFHLGCPCEEEKAVSSLATGVAMVMRDNPALRKYLWEIWK